MFSVFYSASLFIILVKAYMSLPNIEKNCLSTSSTATIALLTTLTPFSVGSKIIARLSRAFTVRVMSFFFSRARATCDVIMMSVFACRASCFCVMIVALPPDHTKEASNTNCTCVKSNAASTFLCSLCHLLVTCQSKKPGLASGVSNAVANLL